MKITAKKSALVFAALKASQQILHDLDSIVLNNSVADMARYGTEQICRISSAGVAAYTIDKAISYLEELTIPKAIRGIIPLTAATLGAGILINSFGDYFNAQAGLGVIETTKQLINNYQQSLTQLVTFNPNVDAGYLTGALLSIKSGARLLKNLGQKTAYIAEKKRIQRKNQEQLELTQRDQSQIPEES